MRVVVVVGEDALFECDHGPDADGRRAGVMAAVRSLAPLAERHELLITYGCGPQLGMLAEQSANDLGLSRPYPLDALTAQAQGMTGYWMLQALQNALPGRRTMAMINQTLVSAFDPAFANPTAPVGPAYDEAEAEKIAQDNGWTVRPDGARWRRVVPSPQPQRVIETRLIRQLIRSGTVVICAGGGGVPVVRNDVGRLEGAEAVVDENLTGATLAEALEADAFLILADEVPAVPAPGDFRGERSAHTTPYQLRAGEIPGGPAGSRIEAVCRFVERTGDMGAIGRIADCEHLLVGMAGMIVTPNATWPLNSTL